MYKVFCFGLEDFFFAAGLGDAVIDTCNDLWCRQMGFVDNRKPTFIILIDAFNDLQQYPVFSLPKRFWSQTVKKSANPSPHFAVNVRSNSNVTAWVLKSRAKIQER
jgi:hypothetical protein